MHGLNSELSNSCFLLPKQFLVCRVKKISAIFRPSHTSNSQFTDTPFINNLPPNTHVKTLTVSISVFHVITSLI